MSKLERMAKHQRMIYQRRTQAPKATPKRDSMARRQKIDQVMQSRNLHDSDVFEGKIKRSPSYHKTHDDVTYNMTMDKSVPRYRTRPTM